MHIHSGYDHDIARGVIRYAKEHGAWQLFGHGWTLAEIIDLDKWQGDGVITRGRDRPESEQLARLGIPIIDVCGSASVEGIAQVTNDDVETGRMAAEHLKACGFEHFAYCGTEVVEWSSRRLSGFLTGLGLKTEQLPVFTKHRLMWQKTDDDVALQTWLKSLPVPCGILAGDDVIGVKITRAAEACGLRIPAQIAVVGVDNEVVLCELAKPSLSSIPCNCERIGFEAAKALNGMMTSNRRDPRSPLRIEPMPVVVRATSDTMAVSDAIVAQALKFIRGNTGLSVNVEDVARALPVSRRALEMRFRKAVGHTIHDEIRRTRLENACRLLATTDMPVAKVAIASGFSNAQRFNAVFVEHEHMAPLAYREKRRKM